MSLRSTIATWMSIVLLSVRTYAIQCPQTCNCYQQNSQQLTVDCGRSEVNESILSEQLDLLLSDDALGERLTSLRISNTPLTQVPQSVCRLYNLTSLGLDHNRLTSLPDNCFTNMISLRHLSAAGNSIAKLQDGLFDGLNSLVELRVGWNPITTIGLHVLSNQFDLVNLKTIDLSNNKLQTLEPWPFIRGLHGSPNSHVPVFINLSSSQISTFTNNIKHRISCSSRSYLKLELGYNNIRHINDVVVGWNLSAWTVLCEMFPGPNSHQWMNGHHPLKFVGPFYSRQYVCDCQDFFYHYISRTYVIHYSLTDPLALFVCSAPPHLEYKVARSVPLEEFVCQLADRCPSGCRCVYRPYNATLHVYCSAANLSSLPLDLPPLPKSYVRYKLDFSNNKLRRLEHRSYFVNTSILDVGNCSISIVDIDAWREFAEMKRLFVRPQVYLHNNKIESLPVEVTGINLTSGTISLNHNPWKCSCGNRWMIAWFKSLSSPFPNGGDVMCASPSRLKGRSIAESGDDDFCVDPAMRMLKISLSPTLSVVVVLLLSGFAVYRLRGRLYRKWKFHPFDRDECAGEDMDYDVFLCCSSEDHSPNGLHVLQLLESNGYRVCYHLRDFLAGAAIADNMIEAIQRSKRTVCLLSTNFVRR